MNYRIMFLSILMIPFFLAFNACTIEGEEICGIWNSNSEYGKMKLEITPWKGKFHGYMLEYDDGQQKIKGAKTEEFVVLYDLLYQEGNYQKGTMILDTAGKQTCSVSFKMTNKHQLLATYNCDGDTSTEIWRREGHPFPKKEAVTSTPSANNTTANAKPKLTETAIVTKQAKTTNAIPTAIKEAVKPSQATAKKEVVQAANNTKKQTGFNVIGVHEVVAYDDKNAMAKAVDNLWNETYNNDFSGQLKNSIDQERMYVVYSNYDTPKGKMTITIGYKVSNLANVPKGLHGITIPANDYYVSPLSGTASDYEGEAWKQFEELAAYRNTTSTDFEVYQFDANYEIKEASIWVAAK